MRCGKIIGPQQLQHGNGIVSGMELFVDGGMGQV
jgi:hypothetical protein